MNDVTVPAHSLSLDCLSQQRPRELPAFLRILDVFYPAAWSAVSPGEPQESTTWGADQYLLFLICPHPIPQGFLVTQDPIPLVHSHVMGAAIFPTLKGLYAPSPSPQGEVGGLFSLLWAVPFISPPTLAPLLGATPTSGELEVSPTDLGFSFSFPTPCLQLSTKLWGPPQPSPQPQTD